MEGYAAQISAGIIAFLAGLFGWMFKLTATRANNAMALSKELKSRVEKLEQAQEDVQKMAVSVAKVETKVEGIEGTLGRIEAYMLEQRKADNRSN